MQYLIGDVFDRMAELPDESVDLVLTSPPFLALRSYLPADHPDKSKEIGSESTPAEYIDILLRLAAEWRRLLAPHGSIVVELGDTYSGSGGAGGDYLNAGFREGQPAFDGSSARGRAQVREYDGGASDRWDFAKPGTNSRSASGPGWPLAKSLTLIPESYRWALVYGLNPFTGQASPAGQWRARNVIRWVRPNPPVGALGDKFRPATSELVVACTSKDRWFDLDAVRGDPEDVKDKRFRTTNGPKDGADPAVVLAANYQQRVPSNPAGAPPLDWWKISPKGYAGAHYAVWPSELCVTPIQAMCPREVCRECGEPRRRIQEKPTAWGDAHPEFRELLRNAREAKGLTQAEVDRHFGFNGMTSHWERRIHGSHSQPSYPTPEQWFGLKELLAIQTDKFDALISGFRRWQTGAVTDEYADLLEATRADGFYQKGDGQARASARGPSIAAQRLTLGWTDCGHDDYRPGLVLDPFAGTGTTLAVAHGHGRDAIGIDIDERSAELARERVGPLFLEVVESPDGLRM